MTSLAKTLPACPRIMAVLFKAEKYCRVDNALALVIYSTFLSLHTLLCQIYIKTHCKSNTLADLRCHVFFYSQHTAMSSTGMHPIILLHVGNNNNHCRCRSILHNEENGVYCMHVLVMLHVT